MKKFVPLILGCLISFSAVAKFVYFKSDGITYKIDTYGPHHYATIEIDPTDTVGVVFEGSLSIPDKVQYETYWYSVVGIESGFFKDQTELTEITLPAYLEKLNSETFMGCTKLRKVTMPDNCSSIGYYCFSGCKSLESISLASLTNVGPYSFYGCKKLKEIELTQKALFVGFRAFSNCGVLDSVKISGLGSNIKMCNWLSYEWAGELRHGPLCRDHYGECFKDTELKYVFLSKCLCNSNYETDVEVISFPFEDVNIHTLEISENLKLVEKGLMKNAEINTLILPEEFQGFERELEMGSLENIICKSPVPPPFFYYPGFTDKRPDVVAEELFDAVLYVPDDAVDAYRSHENWGRFKTIGPMSHAPSGIENAKVDHAAPFSIEGRSILAEPGSNLVVYAIDGKTVWSGRADGPIELPASGIYIVRQGAAVVKVAVP